MKKILSFALALLFSWSVFAQDAYYQSFDAATSEWSIADESSWQYMPNWGSYVSVAPAGTLSTDNAYPYLYSPAMQVTEASNGGEVKFLAASANYDEQNPNENSVAFFMVYAIVDGENVVALGNDSVHSTRQYMKQVSFPLSSLNLTTGTHQIQIVIQHYGQANAGGILEIDDVVIRNRADAYVITFIPYDEENYTGSMNYMVTGENGTLIAPECGFSVSGKHFVQWGTIDENGDALYFGAGAELEGIVMDMIFYAIFEDGEGDEPQPGPENPDVWTVTFNANGGQGTMNPLYFDTEDDNWFNPSQQSCTFTRQGYHFVGWSLSPNGAIENTEINITSNITLYAIWEEDSEPQPGPDPEPQPGPSAINDINNANISIYPNPAQSFVRVNGVTISSLELLDLTGRIIITSEDNTININGINNGVYMLRINAAEGTAVRKIVKR